MQNITLEWIPNVIEFRNIPNSINPKLIEKGFYAILVGKPNIEKKYEDIRLMYIGQAFDQDLKTRIPQPHTAYDCINKFIKTNPSYIPLVMLGTIKSARQERITQELFNDIECCLIYTNQPTCNSSCKEKYSGRQLAIENIGDYSPLNQYSNCCA